MSRGLTVSDEDKDLMLSKLKPILQTGVSLYRAVRFWNVENEHDHIPYTTLWNYRKSSLKVRKKIKGWQDYPLLQARVTVSMAIRHNPKLAMEYLKRREPKEFGDRQEVNNNTNLSGNLKVDLDIDTSNLTLDQKKQLNDILKNALPKDED